MAEAQHSKYPDLRLSQHVFHFSNPASPPALQQSSLEALQHVIREAKMAPLYKHLAHPSEGILNISGEGGSSGSSSSQQQGTTPSMSSTSTSPPTLKRAASSLVTMLATKKPTPTGVALAWDEKLYEELAADNERELAAIKAEEDEAIEKAGETEIQAARAKRAEFWARVGDKDKAVTAYEELLEKTSILGTKIDITFAIIRIGLFFADKMLAKKTIERANALVESGGDWDRRNRLKAYQGVHLLTIRSHGLAAPLLLDSLSTFTSYELCSYSSLIIYAVLAGSVALKRVDFKAKVVDAPEIKAVVGSGEDRLAALSGALAAGPSADDQEMTDATSSATPGKAPVNLAILGQGASELQDAKEQVDFTPLANLVNSLYTGDYRTFFAALGSVEQNFLSQDRYLHEHKAWFVREMRLRAYQQLLQSYRVVGLESMASAFGVTVEFLDLDLKNFIAADRIACIVDRVNGIIETNRPDDKNKQYNDVVKQGDQLITKLQKYGQAVRLRGSERG